jgi:1,4-dihydroxy-2-naphthoate octaprenyltransferase
VSAAESDERGAADLATTGRGGVAAIAPSSLRAWLLAARPATLGAAVVPVAVGSACAAAFLREHGLPMSAFRVGPALGALAGAMWIQIGTNLANDVFEHEQGADTAERLGPTRAVQSGLLTARQVRAGMAAAFTLALACGIYLTAVAGWPVVAIGVASILAGLAYTGGPYPLGYHGLGDLFVMAFFGFVAVCGTAWVQLGQIPGSAWAASLAVGALPTALLVVNNLRDRATDEVAGKRTLAVRFGRGAALGEYVVLLALAYLVPVGLALVGHPFALLALVTLPLAAKLPRRLAKTTGRALNDVLLATARLMVLHGLLLAAGIALR